MKSVYDRVAPSDYYSLFEIARYEGIPEDRMRRLYDEMVKMVLERCKRLNVRYEDVFSHWADVTEVKGEGRPRGWRFDTTLNTLYWQSQTAPFAELFKIFMVKRRAYTKGQPIVWMVDFGIKKSHYDRYKKDGTVYNIRLSRRKAKHEPGNKYEYIRVKETAQYKRFKDGCKRAGALAPEVVMQALCEYMDARKSIFASVDGFLQKDIPLVKVKKKKIHLNVDETVNEQVDLFIQRWNFAGNAPITKEEFVRRALVAYLRALPHRYTDPELWEAEQELLRAQGKK